MQCGRAKEVAREHSYTFLVQSIKDLLIRTRMRKHRDSVAKSHGKKYGVLVLILHGLHCGEAEAGLVRGKAVGAQPDPEIPQDQVAQRV